MTSYVPGTDDPKLAVMYHVGVKGIEAGSMIGAFVVAPVAWLARGRKVGRSLAFYLRREPVVGLAICGPLALVAGHYRLKDATPESIVDRAERITKNRGQQLCDKFAAAGMCMGGLAGSIGFPSGVALGFGQGGALGIAAGVVAYLVYSRTVDQRI